MTEAVADTGAQVAGPSHMKHLGINEVLTPLLNHAGGSPLHVLGSCPLLALHNNKIIETEIYFATGVSNMYLSLDTKISLIPEKFPHVNIDNSNASSINKINVTVSLYSLPDRPNTLPYPPTESSVKNWNYGFSMRL